MTTPHRLACLPAGILSFLTFGAELAFVPGVTQGEGFDSKRRHDMVLDVTALVLARYCTSDRRYLEHAARQIRTWSDVLRNWTGSASGSKPLISRK